ncbi:YihY/virulence factor BrkB family protein [Mycobacterium mantenii]|uniref:Ribonuclease BN n=1 Tax=Mycobacterium mantenii TaxID=560555 RepID=A0A1A2T4E9_MYCNT|nr:YhjD/YihY/BrkB family envelope integrity protein [Mycobacterium mantenii]OBH46563.1 ribonuclease BN [Mycobacterium mantenii]OBH50767.1 ribonuclease BN [Mycobacterium mantenii]OBH71318.1 ribonuclease BN [Mycobacterium mantenii]OBH77700.1 ribonuclease BN [Mycobacterium mantenii]
MVGWLDELQRRNRIVGVIVGVVYKFNDDQGGYLAALITYYGLVSLFPLLLLLTTGLGVVLAGRPDLQAQVLHSTLSQFPVLGAQLHHPEGLSGGTVGVVVGLLGALYGGLGVGQALQNAMDTVWAVPKHKRPNPIRSRLRSLMLLLVLGSAAIAATVLAAAGHATGALGVFSKIGLVLVAVAINALICLVAFRVTTARALTYRQVLPGAVAAALIWQMLQWFGAGYVAHTVKRASATNSVFALVLGALAFLFLASVALVICAEVNVVLVERLYPRALLGAFSDDADLTLADRRTYTKKVKAERVKAFERVHVHFDDVKRMPAKAVGRLAIFHDFRRPRTP